ncbi:hypothetical protein NCAS_0H01230 [Naumovozyma castellii]|uniref:Major facilitator superfamily (MFS) profile domain-containing protein n=1 Tax=Naumovozyma castellii TaxID=27288 RepID=G0VIV6_NAUCA|nr:hypothetical protein NCAS_0H01230 [Naumovozyma castellii CBS 4309]CCC71433.1 hypothetical protein NCAS_0H01230 [Naumovozyma castellii CBS 4309]
MTESNSLLTPKSSGPGKRSSLAPNLIMAIFVTCLGPVQFGYHIAELNAPQKTMICSSQISSTNSSFIFQKYGLDTCIRMTDQQLGAITASFSIGGLVGSFVAGKLAEKYGRKYVSVVNCLIAFLGSFIMFFSNSVLPMILGRTIVGIAAGVSVVVTSLFINDVAPVDWRGSLGTMNQLSINLGILLTQFAGLKFVRNEDDGKWRWVMFIGMVLAILNLVLWIRVAESPRWLLAQGDVIGAEKALFLLRIGSYQDVKQEVQTWKNENNNSSNNDTEANQSTRDISLKEYFKESQFKKARTAITAILVGQQFCGINSIIFYGVKVISQLLPQHAVLINLGISLLNVIFTFVSSTIIDKFGRKPLLITSTSIMAFSSFIISISIVGKFPIILVSSTYLYIVAFALGVGPIPFLIIGELSNKDDKAVAQSYGTVCNWIATFVVGYTFAVLSNWFSGYVYMLFAAFALWFAFYIKRHIPETKGKVDYRDVWSGY